MLFTRNRSRSQRIRDAARGADRRSFARLLRRGRSRAEHVAEDLAERIPEMTEDLLGDLGDRVEAWQKEAAPFVESVAERVPRRRRSRKKTALRLVAGIAFALAVAAVAYLIWQRRDTEPAFLVEEPDEPLTTPDESAPSADGSPNGDDPAVQPHDEDDREEQGAAGDAAPVEPHREPVGPRSGWIPASPVEDRTGTEQPRATGAWLPADAPRATSVSRLDLLSKLPSRPTFLR